jgi:hypothetical protein
MAIIACTQCMQQLQVPDSAFGQHVRCPKCNAVFMVDGPRPSESSAPPPAAYSPAGPVPPAPSRTPDFDFDRRRSYDDEGPRRGYRDDDDDDRGRGYRRGYRDDYRLRDIPTHLAPAILCTLFCCLPFGIVAIVNASQVSTKISVGDYRGAEKASEQAKTWCWISFALGIVPVVIWIIAMLIAARQPGGLR